MNEVKAFCKRWIGISFRFYRLFYSIISTIGLLALLIFGGTISSHLFFHPPDMLRYVSLMLATFGILIIQAAFRHYRFGSFIGLRLEEDKLSYDGILGRVRHPIYSGLILITVGFFLFNPTIATLIFCLSVFLYLPVGIYLEEQKLIKQFGKDYLDYKAKVPMLLPRWPHRK